MEEIWKEFFRLKRDEVGFWLKYSGVEILRTVIFIIIMLDIVLALLTFLFVLAIPDILTDIPTFLWSINGLLISAGFVIWVLKCLIWWLADNWRQAKENVRGRNA